MNKRLLVICIAALAVSLGGIVARAAPSEEEISLDKAPAKVRATIEKHAQGAKINKVEIITDGDKKVYDVEIQKGGQTTEFSVSPEGKYLGVKTDDETPGGEAVKSTPAAKGKSPGVEPKTRPWDQVPAAVRATILANGGKPGLVDKERPKIDGKDVYEIPANDKNGNFIDIVVNEDGKLLEIKTDSATDLAQELAALKFSHPRDVNNPYLPYALLKHDVLDGKEGNRIERTAKPDVHRTFKVGNQTVDTLAVEDREYENGQLVESTLDYFAQADDGTVCYLGEDVDIYKDGKLASHEGAWLYGKHTKQIGVFFPGKPKVGDRFQPENVPKITWESDDVVAVSETVTVPVGKFTNCVKVREHLHDGDTDYKYFAPGVGVVKETEGADEKGPVMVLQKHETRKPGK
jgi:hypothetical protein